MRQLFVSAVFCLTLSLSSAQAQVKNDAAGGERLLAEGRASFALSEMNKQILKEFNGAWQQSGLGTNDTEAAVLVLRESDGSVRAVSGGRTNQSYKFTFTWNPSIIAVVHTHPNNRDPKPSVDDIQVARRFGVPMFTITRQGMFLYDPSTDKITKLKSGTDWCDSSSWIWGSQLAANKASAR